MSYSHFHYHRSWTRPPALAYWLIRRGIVRNYAHARNLLRFIVIFNSVAAALVFILLPPGFGSQNTILNIVNVERNNMLGVIQQFGWVTAFAYLRIQIILALGDLLGLSYALWPLLLVAVLLLAILVYRHHRVR